MEKFIIGEGKNESLCAEIVHRTEIFMKDSRLILSRDFLSIELIEKVQNTITSFKDALEQAVPKNGTEDAQVKSVLQDLIDLEIACHQRKTLQ